MTSFERMSSVFETTVLKLTGKVPIIDKDIKDFSDLNVLKQPTQKQPKTYTKPLFGDGLQLKAYIITVS